MKQIEPTASFPVFITEKLQLSKDYFMENFGFNAVFANDWYVHLVTPNGIQLGFLMPEHSSQPEFFHQAFNGNGAIFSLEVEDADEAYLTAQARGLNILLPLKEEEWGQKHFVVKDPSGVKIDVVQSTEPGDEFKENYT